MMRRSSRKFALVAAFFALSLLTAGGAHAFVLNTSKTGGDCTKFGTWNSRTKTCTMNRDLSAQESSVAYDPAFSAVVKIDAAGITLDGNGHTLSKSLAMPETQPNVGIVVLRKNQVTIKNLNVTGFITAWGIYVQGSQKTPAANFTASNLRFEDCSAGINMNYPNAALISGSTFGNQMNGIALYYGKNVHVLNNTFNSSSIILQGVNDGEFSGNSLTEGSLFCYDMCNGNLIAGSSFVGSAQFPHGGIQIGMGTANTIRDNTFDYSELVLGGGGNVVYHNNFLSQYYSYDSGPPDYTPYPEPILLPNLNISAETPNTMNLPAPTGGNYYNFYDETTEGCADANGDGFCDAPIVFGNGNYAPCADQLPFVLMNGWQ